MARTQLDTAAAAAAYGIKPESFRRERLRGVIPEPDGYVSNSPWWWKSTIDKAVKRHRKPGHPRRTKGVKT